MIQRLRERILQQLKKGSGRKRNNVRDRDRGYPDRESEGMSM